MSERTRRLTLVLVLGAAVVPYFLGLGDSAIWDANEAFYVETPREMIERGDYVGPTFNYEPRLNKPVLSYWIVAAFYQAFGISVGVQRLPIALAAVGLIATALLLAWLAYAGPGGARSRSEAALWAAIGLAVSPRLLMFARRIFIDMYTSLFMALTLLAFAASERYPERRRLLLVLMYVCVGLGVLTKGPVAAVLPAMVFAVYLLMHRELKRVTTMMLPAGAAIVLIVVVPWYAALYQREGWTPIVSFFVGENLDRFTSGLGVRVARGPFFYIPVVFSDSFPWALLLVPAASAWWRDRRGGSAIGPAARVRALLWLWILVIVAFFSLSAGKQDLYIFPIVPAIAALAGCVLARATVEGSSGERAIVARTTAVIAAVLLAIGAGLIYLVRAAGATYAIDGVTAVGAIGALTGALGIWLAARRRVFTAAAALAVGFVALNGVLVLRTLPSFEVYKPVPVFAAAIHVRAAADDVVATYHQALPSLVFYLRRHVEEIFDPVELAGILGSGRRVFVVMSSKDYETVSGQAPDPLCEIDRQPTFDVRLRNVLAREPLPELVLITNRCGE